MKALFLAFCAKIEAFALLHSVPVAYPGVSFTPPPSGLWLEVLAFWNGGDDLGMAARSNAYDQGFFRVLVCSGTGQGFGPVMDMAELLRAQFPIDTRFGGARTERTPTLSGPTIDTQRKVGFVGVTIRWRAVR